MTSLSRREVTRVLTHLSDGNRGALDQLVPLVYAELRRIANRQLGRERPGHTLPADDLVDTIVEPAETLLSVKC